MAMDAKIKEVKETSRKIKEIPSSPTVKIRTTIMTLYQNRIILSQLPNYHELFM